MSTATALKQIVKRSLPGLSSRVGREWRRIGERKADRRLREIGSELADRYGLIVQQGPFAGMKYIDSAVGSALIPKMLGCYERELHPIVEEIISADYDVIVDVGCAEGYYAVGLAWTCDRATVRAFDIDSRGRELCGRLAALNGVSERVSVEGMCDAAVLNGIEHAHALILCDCEGYEKELLRLDRVPRLASWDMLVEFHDFAVPGVTEAIRAELAATHVETIVEVEPRNPADYPALSGCSAEDQKLALSEFRYWPQTWGYFKSRTGDSA